MIRLCLDETGASLTSWPEDYRHVRDAWDYALLNGDIIQQYDEVRVGMLPVFYRHYIVHGLSLVVPAHTGVTTDISPEGNITYIHANPARGVVEQVQLQDTSKLLGFIALRGLPRAA